MNSKTAKALRAMVRESMKPGTPEHKLLAKTVRVMRDGNPVQLTIAVNANKSERGMYLKLKDAYEKHPEVRKHVDSIRAYKKMLRAEQRSGGPTFHQPEEGK